MGLLTLRLTAVLPHHQTTADGIRLSCQPWQLPAPSSDERADRRHRRALEHLAGRRLASRLLHQAGATPAHLSPGPAGAPIWPAGWLGSISHSGGWVAAAVCRRGAGRIGLGLDIQTLISPAVCAEIAPVCFTAAERAGLAAQPLGATLLYAAKEALFKALPAPQQAQHHALTLALHRCDKRRRCLWLHDQVANRRCAVHWCWWPGPGHASGVLALAVLDRSPTGHHPPLCV